MSQLALTFTLNAGFCLHAKLVLSLGAEMLFLPFSISNNTSGFLYSEVKPWRWKEIDLLQMRYQVPL